MKTLLVAGHWYSGSSAVVDFVKGNDRLLGFNQNFSESSVTGGRSGVYALFQAARRRELGAEVVGDFVAQMHGIAGGKHARKMNAMLASDLGPLFSNAVALLAAGMRAGGLSEHALKDRIQEFYSTCYELIPGYDRDSVVVFNNDPAAHHLNILEAIELLPDCRAILVKRNPLDALSDLVQKEGFDCGNASKLDAWIERQKRALSWIEAARKSDRVLVISFEDFVTSESARNRVIDVVNLEKEKCYTHFHPEVSGKNIGIHRAILSEGVSIQIRQALHEFSF